MSDTEIEKHTKSMMQTQSNNQIPKHARVRYYTSVEEARLVEVWRQHFHEIPSYNENLPIFRYLADGMQVRRIKLNKQEVRRRVNSYKNRYFSEQRRKQEDPRYQSSWRLFPLVECIFQKDKRQPDVLENKILEDIERTIRAELPNLPPFNEQQAFQSTKFKHDADVCPFLEVESCLSSSKIEASEVKETKFNETPSIPMETCPTSVAVNESTNKRPPLVPNNHASVRTSCDVAGARRRPSYHSILPRSGHITMEGIEQMRITNQFLTEQRDILVLQLKLKEQQLVRLETQIDLCLVQQNAFLNNIKYQVPVKAHDIKFRSRVI